jgi:hypothetical protein
MDAVRITQYDVVLFAGALLSLRRLLLIRWWIRIQLRLDCMAGIRSTVFNCYMNDDLSMLESH